MSLLRRQESREERNNGWIPACAGMTEERVIEEYGVTPAYAGVQRKMNSYYVYILASKRNGTLYVGVTSDLISRVYQHKAGEIEGFTRRYKVNQLVYYEDTNDISVAIAREKQLKVWKRAWKIRLIEKDNPEWRDLYQDIVQGQSCNPSEGCGLEK